MRAAPYVEAGTKYPVIKPYSVWLKTKLTELKPDRHIDTQTAILHAQMATN